MMSSTHPRPSETQHTTQTHRHTHIHIHRGRGAEAEGGRDAHARAHDGVRLAEARGLAGSLPALRKPAPLSQRRPRPAAPSLSAQRSPLLADRRGLPSSPCSRTTRKQSSKIDAIKAALQNFAYAKSWMRPASVGAPHEFALLGLTNTICWQVPFSSNAAAFAETVESVQACGHFASHCDLDGAFSFAQAELQQSKTSTLRMVLLYGRSQCPPRLVSPARFSWLFQHPGFFLDAMYLHPKQTADNNVQGVFDAITDLEKLLQPPVLDAGSAVAGAAAPVRSQACYMVEGTALSKVHKVQLRSCHTRPPAQALLRLGTEPRLCCACTVWRADVRDPAEPSVAATARAAAAALSGRRRSSAPLLPRARSLGCRSGRRTRTRTWSWVRLPTTTAYTGGDGGSGEHGAASCGPCGSWRGLRGRSGPPQRGRC